MDQILLWDTAADGTVSLSRSASALRDKVMVTHLLGGHVVVRPAELFEGEEFYFRSAVSPDGLLYRLMQAGQASLGLPAGTGLLDRAEWRFQGDRVVDRGKEVKKGRWLDSVKRRTYDRAELLDRLGWGIAPEQQGLSNAEVVGSLNAYSRTSLKRVGQSYFGFGTRMQETFLGEFVFGGEVIQYRGELYARIEKQWSTQVSEDKRAEFVLACKDALTLATAMSTSEQFGGRASELRPESFRAVSYSHELVHGRVVDPEVQVIKAFLRALPDKMSELEKVDGRPLVSAIAEMDAARFAETVPAMVTAEDRQSLCSFLYDTSEELGQMSLVARCASLKEEDVESILPSFVRLRIDEMQANAQVDSRRVRTLIAFMLGIAGEAVLLLLDPHHRLDTPKLILGPTLGVLGERTAHSIHPERPLFGGFRTPL